MKLANSSILILGCNSFFITMREQKDRKTSSVQEKLDIPAQVYVNK
jgi:hypothetical protein